METRSGGPARATDPGASDVCPTERAKLWQDSASCARSRADQAGRSRAAYFIASMTASRRLVRQESHEEGETM